MGILDDAIREHLELKRRHGADNQEVSRQEREILGSEGAAAEPAAYDAADAGAPAGEFVADVGDALPAGEVVEPLAGSPLIESEPEPYYPAAAEARPGPPADIFPGTGELLAAASETPASPPAPAAAAAPRAAAPPLAAPAPADADSETAARSGARRLSDDELAAWRRRLSERADRLAAQRPGAEPMAPPPATAAGASSSTPATPPTEPPAYWSGNTSGSDAGAPPATRAGAAIPPLPPAAPLPSAEAPAGVPRDFFDAGDAEDAFAPERAPEPVAEEQPDGDVLDETPDFLQETPEHDRMWFEQRPPRDFDFG